MKAGPLFIYLDTMYVSVHVGMLIEKQDIFDKSLKFSGIVICGILESVKISTVKR